MAVKREFGIEKQPGEVKDGTGPQNVRAGRPENVDALVSRFLAELSDLSSEIDNKTEIPESDSGPQAGAGGEKQPSIFSLPEEADAGPDEDSGRISEEIERTLAELEALNPTFAVTKENPPPAEEVNLAEPASLKSAAPVEPASPPHLIDPEEQAWKKLEIFRSSISKPKPALRLSAGWILAGVVLLGILGISAFYFFNADGSAPNAHKEAPGIEAKSSEPSPVAVQATPVASEKAPAAADSKKAAKPLEPINSPAQDDSRSKAAPKIAARNLETSGGRSSGSGGSQETRPATEATNRVNFAEKTRINEEPSRPSSVQVADGALTPQQAPASPPPAAATPSKQPPGIPAATEAVISGSPASPPAAPPRETAPLASKPALPVNNDAPIEAVQAKPRTPVSAEVIKKVPPVYPIMARTQKISGKVEVEAEINDNGDVFRAKAVSGPDMLRGAAEEALRKWKFKPATVDGIPVPSKARIAVNFSLQ